MAPPSYHRTPRKSAALSTAHPPRDGDEKPEKRINTAFRAPYTHGAVGEAGRGRLRLPALPHGGDAEAHDGVCRSRLECTCSWPLPRRRTQRDNPVPLCFLARVLGGVLSICPFLFFMIRRFGVRTPRHLLGVVQRHTTPPPKHTCARPPLHVRVYTTTALEGRHDSARRTVPCCGATTEALAFDDP